MSQPPPDAPPPAAPPAEDLCPHCEKPRAICVCDRITEIATRTHVLILQHPQEPDKVLGTVPLVALSIPRTTVNVGLSWASLSHALGREADAKRWAVLYMGSLPKPLTPAQEAKPVVLLDRLGNELDPQRAKLEGVVVLDGTWSQAKTLWWRNAWMLKLNRLILHPREPSAYGKLRKQPQRGHLSTIEAVGEALVGLGEDPAVLKTLRSVFRTMLQRARDSGVTHQATEDAAGAAPQGAKRRPGGPPRRQGRGGAPRRSKGGGPLD